MEDNKTEMTTGGTKRRALDLIEFVTLIYFMIIIPNIVHTIF